VLIYCVSVFLLSSVLVGELVRFQVVPFACAVLLLALAVVLASQGVALGLCLLVVTAAPAVIVVVFEAGGHRAQAAALSRALA
jgi:hypothetical protein